MESTIQNKMHCLSIINCYIACSSIILFIHFESVKGQNITLFKYNQNDAKTECILGLKSGKDIVVFKALVRDYHKADYVLFEIDKSGGKFWQSIHLDFKIPFASKYETVCLVRNYAIHINIYIGAPSEFSDATVDFKSTDSSNNDTVCIVRNETIHLNIYTTAENDLKKATIDFENLCPSNNDTECIDFNEPIHVHIYIKAETEYSKAKMKGSLFILGRYVTKSDEQTFPEIYDSSHATYTLTINGMDALKNESVCFINDNGSIPFELKLESSNQPLPCVLEIMSDEGTSTKKGPNGTAFIKIERKSMKGNITIKYGSCSLSENTRIIECSWENKVDQTNHKQDTDNTSINKELAIGISVPVSIIAIVCICIIIIWVIKRYYFKRKPKRKSEMINQKNNAEQNVTLPLIGGSESTAENTCRARMLPISDFKKDTLPKEYRHNSLVSLVQNISILTGRLNIDYVSDKRPEKYPDSDDPYPLYDKSKKGAHDSRFATGIVVGVEKNTDTDALCYCFDCRSQGSTTTKKWGKVYLLTTKTVIFDKSEALKTKFTLFFDNKTRVLSGSSVKDSDINYDWCEVECATCDTTLIDKLSDNLERCSTEMKSVNSHFIGELTRPKLAIIVFHPFKQPKTFSYGFWKDRFEGNKNTWTNYEYNVGTERGAAGAFVYIVGVSDISKRYVHVHCGLRNHGGYSSFGLERTNDASNINDNRGPRVDN